MKTLVAVSRVEYAEALYESLVDVLDEYDTHVLDVDDLGFAHGSTTSTGDPADVFLDEFAVRPRGLLVATAQLLGEGFDDPSINTVVVTYPTTSMVQLMQAAGRCLRLGTGQEQRICRSGPGFGARVPLGAALAVSGHLRSAATATVRLRVLNVRRPRRTDRRSARARTRSAQAAEAVRASLAEVEAGEHVSLLLTRPAVRSTCRSLRTGRCVERGPARPATATCS